MTRTSIVEQAREAVGSREHARLPLGPYWGSEAEVPQPGDLAMYGLGKGWGIVVGVGDDELLCVEIGSDGVIDYARRERSKCCVLGTRSSFPFQGYHATELRWREARRA